MRKYTQAHHWIDIHETTARIGLMQDAVKEIGTIVFIELPKVGTIVTREELVAVLESTKAAVEIVAPLTGQVIAVNDLLLKNIAMLNEQAESIGWLFEMDIHDFNGALLIDKKSYEEMMRTSS